GGWVIRGGLGDLIPLNGGKKTLINPLAIRQTFTAHDVPLIGDFTYHPSTGGNTPPPHRDPAHAGPAPPNPPPPGPDRDFPAGLPIRVTKDRVADLGMIFWFMKAW